MKANLFIFCHMLGVFHLPAEVAWVGGSLQSIHGDVSEKDLHADRLLFVMGFWETRWCEKFC